MFEVMNPDSSASVGAAAPYVVPRHIFMEGSGDTDKGLKIEWATVREDKLYVGSFGKEYTDSKGDIVHSNTLWVVVVEKDGTVTHQNWNSYYTRMREELGYLHPSYLLHEAIIWSPHHKQWFVLPRRMSREPYNDVEDERRGANTLITANGDFSIVKHREIGVSGDDRGSPCIYLRIISANSARRTMRRSKRQCVAFLPQSSFLGLATLSLSR
jgi:soluble calcium-activated nucleotidase 1